MHCGSLQTFQQLSGKEGSTMRLTVLSIQKEHMEYIIIFCLRD